MVWDSEFFIWDFLFGIKVKVEEEEYMSEEYMSEEYMNEEYISGEYMSGEYMSVEYMSLSVGGNPTWVFTVCFSIGVNDYSKVLQKVFKLDNFSETLFS
jgi:hypothetical protein